MSEERKVTIKDAVDTIIVGRYHDPATNTEKLLTARAQDDGTIRLHTLQIVRDSDGREHTATGETSGELRNVPLLHDGSNLVRALAESNRALGVSLYGSDEAGNLNGFRTDPDRVLWTRDRPVYIDIDPVEIPVAEGDLWDPGGLASTITYEVAFNVVNNDAGAAAVTVSVGLDLASGGTLAAPEYWMFNEVVNYPGSSGWRGPFIMHGDDQIRGVASVANDASIHFRVKRVDTGA